MWNILNLLLQKNPQHNHMTDMGGGGKKEECYNPGQKFTEPLAIVAPI